MKSKFIAIIPARRQSKRLPGKNTKILCGKPLISWTIEAAIDSNCFESIVVTTDDEQVKEISKGYDVLIVDRPSELASDHAKSIDVVTHVLNRTSPDITHVALLQPTSPLRSSTHIQQSIQLLETQGADAVISVAPTEHNPAWCQPLAENLSMDKFFEDARSSHIRSQALGQYYRLNGAIYLCDRQKLLHENSFFLRNNSVAFVMDCENSIDIDRGFDFAMAEVLLSKRSDC